MSWEEADTKNFVEVLDKFKEQMVQKFIKKFNEGYRGWNNLTKIPQLWNFHLKEKLLKNLVEEDWIDVANLALMLWWNNRNIHND